MSIRAINSTKNFLVNVPLPKATNTYTTISHGFIIDKSLDELKTKGFEVERELYRSTKCGNIGQGIYHLKYGSDPEMGMMFAWSNSYDKSMKFKSSIGGVVHICLNGMVSGNMGNYIRKHTGTALQDTTDMITDQIANADIYYNQLVMDKELMKNVILTKRDQAEIMGRIYFEHGLLTTEQLNVVKAESKKPTYDYNSNKDSLWQLYNGITLSLQKAHPKQWLDQQQMIHLLLTKDYVNIPVASNLMIEANVLTTSPIIKDLEESFKSTY